MERFIVYSKKFDSYFKPAQNKSLYYSEDDFGHDEESCKWFKQEKIAFEMATNLYLDFQTDCVRIYVGVDILETIPTGEMIAAKLKECKELMDNVDALSDKDCEALPEKQWKEYLTAKTYVRTHEIA